MFSRLFLDFKGLTNYLGHCQMTVENFVDKYTRVPSKTKGRFVLTILD